MRHHRSGREREGCFCLCIESLQSGPLHFGAPASCAHTGQAAEEAFAAGVVPHQQGVSTAPFLKLHVDGLGAQAHLQVAQLRDWMAVPLLQPIGQLAVAGQKHEEGWGLENGITS